MSSLSKVTVVIPLYNKEKYIKQALHSVITQTFTDWEILIINDASTDHSLKEVGPYVDGKKIKCISLSQNLGLTHVLNYALTKVKTPYFVHLDADDWLEPTSLEKQVSAMEKHPHAALVYGDHIVYLENDEGKVEKIEKITHESYHDRYDFLTKLNHTLTPRFYRTQCVRHIGGWLIQSAGDLYIEDVQILLRLAGKFELIWINEFLYHRRKYKQNIEEFQKNRPLRWNYRYHFYNQMLYEWGNEKEAIWIRRDPAIYLNKLIDNPNPKREDPQWLLP